MDSSVDQPNECRPAHWWKPGQAPVAHRPKGSLGGRAQALIILDSVMGDEKNKATLRAAMQAEFDKGPMRFFRTVIMPLLPRDVIVKLGEEGVIKWTSLLDTFPMPASEKSITIEASDSAPSAAAGDGGRPALPPPSSST